MDTDTTGNHASYNQNTGMWKAYGLLYKLLKSGIPVHWAIKENKVYNDIDFTVAPVKDKRTGTALTSWSYRGGPFIIDSSNATAALPIINDMVGNQQQPAQRPRSAGLLQCRCEYRLDEAPRVLRTRLSTGAYRSHITTRPASPIRPGFPGR